MKYSIKKAWLIYIVVVVVLPPLLILPWFMLNEYSVAVTASLQKQNNFNARLDTELESGIARLINILENKSDAIGLQMGHKKDSELIHDLLKIIMAREDFIHGLLVVTTQGKIESAIDRGQVNALKNNDPDIMAASEWLKAHWGLMWKNNSRSTEFVIPLMGSRYVSAVNQHEGRNIFRISIPVNYKKITHGFLIAEIEIDGYLKKWKRIASASEGLSYLIDSRGMLLVDVKNTNYKTGEILSSKKLIEDIISESGRSENDVYVGLGGNQVYVTSQTIPLLNWTLVSEVDEQAIIRPIKTKLIETILIVFLMSVIFILVGVRMLYSLIRPIESLSSAIRLFSQDESSVKEIPKTNVSELSNVVEGFNNMAAERSKMDAVLQKSKDRLLLHRDQSPLGVIEWNTEFEFLDWNPAAEKIFGFKKAEVLGQHITKTILPESAREAVDEVWQLLLTGKGGFHSINENTTKNGRIILCEWTNTPLKDKSGKVVGVNSFVEDVTEKKQQEEQLRQRQKMDALDKLSGGISHDFNNLLNAIMGYADLINSNTDNVNVKKYASVIMTAGERGAKLTKKLLRFASHEAHHVSVVDINDVIKDEAPILEKSLTSRIHLLLDIDSDLWPVRIDGADLQDAILNICINAMHAIEGNGNVTISTSNTTLNQNSATNMGIAAGDYVILKIADTGCGIEEEALAHIFDPFFTTKGEMGTGLGLSQVYGFVKRAGGILVARSEIDKGSDFTMYLPRYIESEAEISKPVTQNIETDFSPSDSMGSMGGNESILVVDDEEGLRDLCVELLLDQGYKVLSAEDGEKALILMEKNKFDLVLSDVVMPNMDGYTLANTIRERWPDIKIQLVSGFTDKLYNKDENESLHKKLIYKPYKLEEILRRIRELLDE